MARLHLLTEETYSPSNAFHGSSPVAVYSDRVKAVQAAISLAQTKARVLGDTIDNTYEDGNTRRTKVSTPNKLMVFVVQSVEHNKTKAVASEEAV